MIVLYAKRLQTGVSRLTCLLEVAVVDHRHAVHVRKGAHNCSGTAAALCHLRKINGLFVNFVCPEPVLASTKGIRFAL